MRVSAVRQVLTPTQERTPTHTVEVGVDDEGEAPESPESARSAREIAAQGRTRRLTYAEE